MSDDSRPRVQFWVRPPSQSLPFGACALEPTLGGIHVVEYAAFEAAERERNEARAQRHRWFNEHQKVLDVKNELRDQLTKARAEIERLKRADADAFNPYLIACGVTRQLCTRAQEQIEVMNRLRAENERLRDELAKSENLRGENWERLVHQAAQCSAASKPKNEQEEI